MKVDKDIVNIQLDTVHIEKTASGKITWKIKCVGNDEAEANLKAEKALQLLEHTLSNNKLTEVN